MTILRLLRLGVLVLMQFGERRVGRRLDGRRRLDVLIIRDRLEVTTELPPAFVHRVLVPLLHITSRTTFFTASAFISII